MKKKSLVGYENRICPVCKKTFVCLREKIQTYCSKSCVNKGVVHIRSGSTKRKGNVKKQCMICKKIFFVGNCDKEQKYCSRECQYKDFAKISHRINQGKKGKTYIELYGIKKGIQIASDISLGHLRRNKTHNKDPRRTPEEEILHSAWRASVFVRDKYTCRKCGLRGELNAHHIKSWINHPELRHEVNNGITLCIPCHLQEHKKKEHGL